MFVYICSSYPDVFIERLNALWFCFVFISAVRHELSCFMVIGEDLVNPANTSCRDRDFFLVS